MVRKRLDERIRALLERGVATGQRSMLVLVGDHGKDQVPNLHHILSKCTLQRRPKVLWCYKKELGFSTHRKKRMKKLKRDKARGLTTGGGADGGDGADNFELFISSTDITWCYYKDSHRILGTTTGVLVLQDFEALTPNLMARTIETVQGGGLIIFLLRTVSSLQQLYAMTMDVHARFRTEASADVVPRFNERFILSLASCTNCLVCDDELNVLPLSKKALHQLAPANTATKWSKGDAGDVVVPITPDEQELQDLQESLSDTPHVGVLVELTKTLDQAKAVLVVMDACSADHTANKTLHSTTIAMTAARGRGKSAAMGLCLAGAVSLGYSTICVTAPEPENLVAVFDFVVRGLQALKYQEHLDYRITYNNAAGREQTKCVVSIHIYKTHRQVIQYIPPDCADKFQSAELVAIDEAAAIPLPIVRTLMQQPDRITLLSSTINGYEGTGRALSLKLIKELRDKTRGRQADAAHEAASSIAGPKQKKGEAKVHEQRWAAAAEAAAAAGETLSGPLREVELVTPIRYSKGDSIEAWLNQLLCLDCGNNLKLHSGAPAPADCELYSVDRDALFSYHKLSEAFLQKVMSLYTSAHYKNTPNDLQMLSDAPAHALYVLLSPTAEKQQQSQASKQPALPDVLAVVQVALEGRISRKAVEAQLARGHRSAGDMIPWTISQQFGDSKFAQLSGARIVRIAVHPSVQGMGYGSRAVELLYRFYNGEIIPLANTTDDDDDDDDDAEDDENEQEDEDALDDDQNEGDDPGDMKKSGILVEKVTPRKELPPLLLPLTEVDAPRLDWIGTSFGLTTQLHKFWSRAGMRLLYLRQTTNELTGEHSVIMVRALPKRTGVSDSWLSAFVGDTKRRLLALFGGAFRNMSVRLAIAVLENLEGVGPSNGGQAVSSSKKITAEEVNYFLAPHDLKRLEMYGRNLCDHHLISDLLPVCARLYFTSRFGDDVKLSGLQAALLCGLGLQSKTVDDITAELNLPSNQVLAMFNKILRKLSIALNTILEEKEKEEMLGGRSRSKAEAAANRMRDVASTTLEEDAEDAAKKVMDKLVPSTKPVVPKEIAKDAELMQYVVKGSEEQWKKALKESIVDGPGTVQIHTTREKRKLDDEDLEKESNKHNPTDDKGQKSKKGGKRSAKKNRKSS